MGWALTCIVVDNPDLRVVNLDSHVSKEKSFYTFVYFLRDHTGELRFTHTREYTSVKHTMTDNASGMLISSKTEIVFVKQAEDILMMYEAVEWLRKQARK